MSIGPAGPARTYSPSPSSSSWLSSASSARTAPVPGATLASWPPWAGAPTTPWTSRSSSSSRSASNASPGTRIRATAIACAPPGSQGLQVRLGRERWKRRGRVDAREFLDLLGQSCPFSTTSAGLCHDSDRAPTGGLLAIPVEALTCPVRRRARLGHTDRDQSGQVTHQLVDLELDDHDILATTRTTGLKRAARGPVRSDTIELNGRSGSTSPQEAPSQLR